MREEDTEPAANHCFIRIEYLPRKAEARLEVIPIGCIRLPRIAVSAEKLNCSWCPRNRSVFCVDEQSAIQALDRLDPRLPLSPGRAARHEFEYFRHGVVVIRRSGREEWTSGRQTAARHTSEEFVDFLGCLDVKTRWANEIHIVLDNLSAHKIKKVGEFLEAHPNVKLHFTPLFFLVESS
jgi:hypothetical protein